MDNSIIWDGSLDKYRSFLLAEIQNAVPTIEEIIDISIYEKLQEALDSAQEHQLKHVKDTKLKEKSLDTYKAISWITCTMSRLCKNTSVFECTVRAGIEALDDNLREDKWPNNGLPERTKNLIDAMFKNELSGIPEHGIERNGLFLCFHSALEILKNCNQ